MSSYSSSRPRLTKYERTKIIGVRAEQLARGAQPFVDMEPGETCDPYELAERELLAKKLPFSIVRQLPDGKPEVIRLEDLVVDYY